MDLKYFAADTQGELFRYMVKQGYDLIDFALRFMSSKETELYLDKDYTIYQHYKPELLITYFSDDVQNPIKAKDVWAPELSWWVGWAYRFLTHNKELKSKEVVKAIPPKRLISVYPAYHTFLNDYYLLERLYEDYEEGISKE